MNEEFHTIVVSDIHLGTSVSRIEELLSFLKNASFQQLILLGDIFDNKNLNKLKRADWDFLYYLRSLAKKTDKEVILIRGNHDQQLIDALSHIIGVEVQEEYVWEHNNKKYLAIHGDQFDRFLINNKLINKISPKFYFFFQFFNFRNKLLYITPQVAKGALKYAEESNIDFILCGHTHEAIEKTHQTKDGRQITYYNTGCWTKFPSTYVAINDTGAEVKKYNASYSLSFKKLPFLKRLFALRENHSQPL